MMTFEERKEELLRTLDVDLLCEALQIEAEDLLLRFEDKLIVLFDREDEE